MTLRERLERGTERRVHQVEETPLRRRTDMVAIEIHTDEDTRPEWLRRSSFRRDLTEVES